MFCVRRGAGNLLGADQSGFAAQVGLDAYMRLLKKTGATALGIYLGPFEYHHRTGTTAYDKVVLHLDMPGSLDRLRAWPRVDSFYQTGSFVRLFLPYQPLRDNLILDEFCESTEEAANRLACLRELWSVRIDGTPVPMAQFVPAERIDLGMRGLIGAVPMTDLEPGLHQIEITWNPAMDEEAAPLDDRYAQARIEYVIPIAFAPEYELPLN